MNASYPVTRQLVLELLGPEGTIPVEAELRYEPFDPYAVAMAFFNDGHEVVWHFGRDLLMTGLYEPTGDGDVQIFPSLDADDRAVIRLVLHSPHGQAIVEAQARDVLGFLARTIRAVWPGTEGDLISADAAIAAILVSD